MLLILVQLATPADIGLKKKQISAQGSNQIGHDAVELVEGQGRPSAVNSIQCISPYGENHW
jgi:hypothetical protein